MSGEQKLLVLRMLIDVRATVSREASWTKFASARDARGTVVPPDSGDAVRWCLTGAIERVFLLAGLDYISYPPALHVLNRALKRVIGPHSHETIVGWNDRLQTTHHDVLAALDAAIEQLSREETLDTPASACKI